MWFPPSGLRGRRVVQNPLLPRAQHIGVAAVEAVRQQRVGRAAVPMPKVFRGQQMDPVLVPLAVPDANEHIVKPLVPNHMRRPEEPLLVLVPIRHYRKRFLVPGRLGERLRRRMQQVLARVPKEIHRQNVRDGKHVPRSIRPPNERVIVNAPGISFARFWIEDLGELARPRPAPFRLPSGLLETNLVTPHLSSGNAACPKPRQQPGLGKSKPVHAKGKPSDPIPAATPPGATRQRPESPSTSMEGHTGRSAAEAAGSRRGWHN